jgi:hypothetical protein
MSEKLSLIFKIGQRFNIPPISPVNLDEKYLQDYKDKANEYYKDFIAEINACGGYLTITPSQDGLSIASENLSATVEVLEKIRLSKSS